MESGFRRLFISQSNAQVHTLDCLVGLLSRLAHTVGSCFLACEDKIFPGNSALVTLRIMTPTYDILQPGTLKDGVRQLAVVSDLLHDTYVRLCYAGWMTPLDIVATDGVLNAPDLDPMGVLHAAIWVAHHTLCEEELALTGIDTAAIRTIAAVLLVTQKLISDEPLVWGAELTTLRILSRRDADARLDSHTLHLLQVEQLRLVHEVGVADLVFGSPYATLEWDVYRHAQEGLLTQKELHLALATSYFFFRCAALSPHGALLYAIWSAYPEIDIGRVLALVSVASVRSHRLKPIDAVLNCYCGRTRAAARVLLANARFSHLPKFGVYRGADSKRHPVRPLVSRFQIESLAAVI